MKFLASFFEYVHWFVCKNCLQGFLSSKAGRGRGGRGRGRGRGKRGASDSDSDQPASDEDDVVCLLT